MRRAFVLMTLTVLATGLLLLTGCNPRDGDGQDEIGEVRVFDTPRQAPPSNAQRTETPGESVPAPKPTTTETVVAPKVTTKEECRPARVQTEKPRRVTQHHVMIGELDMQD